MVSKESDELTWEENIFWYLALVQQLKGSPVREIVSQIGWEGSNSPESFVLFFSHSSCLESHFFLIILCLLVCLLNVFVFMLFLCDLLSFLTFEIPYLNYSLSSDVFIF